IMLLSEMLRVHPVPSQHLFQIIRDLHVQPRWEEMHLPMGRSLKSCQMAWAEMNNTLLSYSPFVRPPTFAPSSDPMAGRRPPLQMESPIGPVGSGRLIQPRPPGGGPMQVFSSNFIEEPARKKRGRPTNAEMARKVEEAKARGEEYPPQRKKPRQNKTEKESPLLGNTTDAPQSSAGSPITPAPVGIERPIGTSMAPAVQPTEGFVESSSGSRGEGRIEQEPNVEGEGEDPSLEEQRETISRYTTTQPLESQRIPTRGGPGAPEALSEATSGEAVQATTDATMTTIPSTITTSEPEIRTTQEMS
ncbi:MAG: hypothetical protein M1820_007705, partial [Bogoriella megaspora]